MEETQERPPLSNMNGSKPPSRLLQPGSLSARKRAAQDVTTHGKENDCEPAKRPKLDGIRKPLLEKPEAKPKKALAKSAKNPPVRSVGTNKKPAVKPPLVKSTLKAAVKTAGSLSSRASVTKPKPPTSKALSKAQTSSSSSTAGTNGKQKRCAWDLKGRLQDMEVRMTTERQTSSSTIESLSTQLEKFAERLDHLESVRVEQEGTIKIKQEETSAASQTIKSLEEELSALKMKYRTETEDYEERLSTIRREHSSLKRSHEDLEGSLSATRQALHQLTADTSALQCRYDTVKMEKEAAMADNRQKSEAIASLEDAVKRHLATIAECEARIREDETTRRKLHNTIQELKGNIRVFCRVRPSLPVDSNTHSRSESKLDVDFPDRNRDRKNIVLGYTNGDQITHTGGAAAMKSYNFEFDRVFDQCSTQEAVFSEISQLVQSALDGYNVCIFAYGQTGSGKTFTMEGPENTLACEVEPQVDRRGMIPRAVEQVFNTSVSLKEQGWQYKLEASFLEIYNESIRDLLSSSSSSSSVSHDIKMDPNHPGGVHVTNITPVVVKSQTQVVHLLERAARNRAVSATNCNERSSRSHSVFQLHITGSNEITGEKCKGTLSLVDLAGSERLAQSGSVGERLKETKHINKSLSNLGQVIMALSNKEQYIPYRNSKLTYLLQNSLGGNSKTLMFVNLSPQASSFQETLCSLRFATQVNQCNIGTARKSTK